jgi:hypothetical protein
MRTLRTKTRRTTGHLETEFVNQVGNIFTAFSSHLGTISTLGNTARHDKQQGKIITGRSLEPTQGLALGRFTGLEGKTLKEGEIVLRPTGPYARGISTPLFAPIINYLPCRSRMHAIRLAYCQAHAIRLAYCRTDLVRFAYLQVYIHSLSTR